MMESRKEVDSTQNDDAFLAAQFLIVLGGFIAVLLFGGT